MKASSFFDAFTFVHTHTLSLATHTLQGPSTQVAGLFVSYSSFSSSSSRPSSSYSKQMLLMGLHKAFQAHFSALAPSATLRPFGKRPNQNKRATRDFYGKRAIVPHTDLCYDTIAIGIVPLYQCKRIIIIDGFPFEKNMFQ